MSNPELVLRYHHDDGHTCTGELKLRWSDGSQPVRILEDIYKMDFNKMMAKVSGALNEHSIEKLVVERSDRDNLKPFVFDNPMTELLRNDPVAALRMMNPPPIHIDLRKQKMPPPTPVFTTTGYDTLAESFGDEVYAKMRSGSVECPGCGMWSPQIHSDSRFHCSKKCLLVIDTNYVEGWALFKYEELLTLNLARYYFPRGWNKSGGWISQDDLRALFEQWKKEKTS